MMAIINTSANNNSSSTKLSSTANQNSVLIPSSSSSASTTSSMEDENVICPLCMENLDIDDRSFYPCTCGYQICRFCWHRIRSESDDQNGLCPACRKQYSENPATFKPLSSEDIQKLKLQKRQKDQQKKQKSESGKKHLADLRVVQKNLVFVVGISPRIADPDVLKKNEFFGKFGKIHKVVVNPCLQGTTASAYITYIKSDDALRAIQSVNNIPFDGKTIKVSLGTTKYCSHFMRNQTCPKTECMYLHHYGDPDASFTKEDMQAGKHQDYEKKLLDEFNTHQNNNNNNESSGGGEQRSQFNGVAKESVIKNGKRIANGSSIQQGVSYSTKLLVNNTPQQPQPSQSPPQQPQKPQPDRTPQQPNHPSQSTTPPCSSSASSTSSTEHNLATATTLLENTILSEDEDNCEEEEFHETTSESIVPEQTQQQHNHQQEQQLEYDNEYSSSNTLDLDFDPFHETQKAFEEIINEQVGGGDQAEQSSLLRRFIKPVQDEDERRNDYLLGFHTQQHASPPPQTHQPYNQTQNTTQSSLLLDFFNNYAYKHVPHTQSTSIPPPPGFSNTTQLQPQNPPHPTTQSSSALLEKLNRTLLGTNSSSTWGNDLEDQRIIPNTTADWMSLDPAIIFSKTSTERIAERGNQNRNYVDNPLHGIFGDRGLGLSGGSNLGMHHHFSNGEQRDRVFQTNVGQGFGGSHPLIRPTPTTTSPQSTQYGYTVPQQQQQQQFYTNQRPNNPYYHTQQQQSRYYPQQQTSVVTPPPPGFGGLHTPLHKPTQPNTQFTNQQVYALQQGMHNGSSSNSTSGFFPF